MKGKSIRYSYQTALQWTKEKKGIIKSKGKPDLEVACPPEFGGHDNIWSPEDLFLASVEVCTMTTFLWFVKKENIELNSYKSNTIGFAELINNIFRFHSIKIHIEIGISKIEDKTKIDKIFKKIPKTCLITKSIHTNVDLDVDISMIP